VQVVQTFRVRKETKRAIPSFPIIKTREEILLITAASEPNYECYFCQCFYTEKSSGATNTIIVSVSSCPEHK